MYPSQWGIFFCLNSVIVHYFGYFIAVVKVKRLYERYLRVIYDNKKSTLKVLLQKDNLISIHKQNIRVSSPH